MCCGITLISRKIPLTHSAWNVIWLCSSMEKNFSFSNHKLQRINHALWLKCNDFLINKFDVELLSMGRVYYKMNWSYMKSTKRVFA